MSLILWPSDFPQKARLMGGKARALAELSQAGFAIPAWFVLNPEAFYLSLSPEQDTILKLAEDAQTLSDLITQLKTQLKVSKPVTEAVHEALGKLAESSERFAVRSSAADEDGTEHSFAGQLDSFLFVKSEDVIKRILQVWLSGFSERVLYYRKEAGLSLLPSAPSVLVQRMIRADSSGVAFGADPVSGRRSIRVVSAVYGLGTALVSGEVDADTFLLDRSLQVISQTLAHKASAHYQDDQSPEGISSQAIAADLRDKAALSPEQIKQVAQLAQQVSQYFTRPQDIEWALMDSELFLLQSRPITSLYGLADPDGQLGIWDNSNIVESYGGITTPLTFSFALYAYEGVYRELLRLLGVSKQKRLEQENTFKHMLGLFRGRIYYNLLSWYKLLATLPGFQINRGFMEQMMGVKEGLPEEVLASLHQPSSKRKDSFDLAIALLKLLRSYSKLPKDIKRFYQRLEQALASDLPLAEMRSDELIKHYRELEARLLKHWDAPLVNDFFAMIFYGLLRRLCERWLADQNASLQNNLISGEGGMISAEPAKRVIELAQLAAQDPDFVTLLCHGSQQDIRLAMQTKSAFAKAYSSYLDTFGDRCLEELKLESPSLSDDPILLLRSVGNLAQYPESLTAKPSTELSLRSQAEQRVKQSLKNPVRKAIFNWVLKAARDRVRDRENLRFERTRLFGHVRKLFLELGKRLYALNLLHEVRDIFYLELAEILALFDGTSSLNNLKALVALRKAEFAAYALQEAPSSRFETRGLVYQGHAYQAAKAPSETPSGDTRQGIACCPGVVRGYVSVVTDPRDAKLQVGDILVAKQTDPGWIMLFPAASGLLVERGSLLSHSAIVAREMNLPAIVAVPELTSWLKTGDYVEFDGSSGRISKLPKGPEHE